MSDKIPMAGKISVSASLVDYVRQQKHDVRRTRSACACADRTFGSRLVHDIPVRVGTPRFVERPIKRSAILKSVVLSGLVAGAIDLSYAILANGAKGVPPVRVLQSVASGLLGRASMQGGAPTAFLGAMLHFLMTIFMAAIFVLVVVNAPVLRRHIWLAGALYGALIYFGMRWLVVPFSNFPGDLRHFNAVEFLVHVIGVGLVIAFAAHRLLIGSDPNGRIPKPRSRICQAF